MQKYLFILLLLILSCDEALGPEDCAGISGGDAVSDIDGNCYSTIQIGEQVWMAENLKVTHYNDGSEIQYVQSESSEPDVWENLSSGAYGYYNDDPTNLNTYGNLYNWAVVDDERGVCPDGFHVPSNTEYAVLTDYLGNGIVDVNVGTAGSWGYHVAGGKMKEAGLEHWNYYSDEITEEATNESGFTGLPAGYRNNSTGTDHHIGVGGYFWSSSYIYNNYAWYLLLVFNSSIVYRSHDYKQNGYSIRCLKD